MEDGVEVNLTRGLLSERKRGGGVTCKKEKFSAWGKEGK